MAKILLTGGSGDLGQIIAPQLIKAGYEVRNIDINPSPDDRVEDVTASILDREKVREAFKGIETFIHIAAWHGVHSPARDAYDFHDLNVTGTMNVFEAAAREGCKKGVFISSTSVSKPYSVYGHSKILNEEQARAYSHRHEMDMLVLRPRAFIPPWNRDVYKTYADWANWFTKGAVHIDDVAQATVLGTEYVRNNDLQGEVPVLTVDGAFEYTPEDIKNWDKDGEGSTFINRYGKDAYNLLKSQGIDPTKKPKILDITETRKVLGYEPTYSLQNLIDDVRGKQISQTP